MSSRLPPEAGPGSSPGPGPAPKPDPGLDPSHHKWAKWASMATVAGAFIGIVGVYAALKASNSSNTSNTYNTTSAPAVTDTITKKDTLTIRDTVKIKDTLWKKIPGSDPRVGALASTTAKPENLWTGQLEGKLREILANKGYKNIGNISGTLVLPEPVKTADNKLSYTLTLTIDFFVSSTKKSCGQLRYHYTTTADADISKDQILEQGLHSPLYPNKGVLVQLQHETYLPPCLNP